MDNKFYKSLIIRLVWRKTGKGVWDNLFITNINKIVVFYFTRLSAFAACYYQIYYQFWANGNFSVRFPGFLPSMQRDSISTSSRSEVSSEWLLSHFRSKKKSNKRMRVRGADGSVNS